MAETLAPSELALERDLQWKASALDPVYFIDHFWSIEIVGSGYEVATLRDYQVEEINRMLGACNGTEQERQLRLKARQVGWTTIAMAFAFWSAFFWPNHSWLCTMQSEKDAQKQLLKKVKNPYFRLPVWMRDRGPELVTENMTEMRFENDSSITATHSADSASRGDSVYGVVIDEAAFVEDAGSLFAALDPLCYGPMFVFSTANGIGNFFHEIWLDSQLHDSEWGAHFLPWSVVPGRDDVWYAKRKRLYRTKPHLFYQEYPSNAAEAFAKSGRTAIPLDLLDHAPHMFDPPEWKFDIDLLLVEVLPEDYDGYAARFREALIDTDDPTVEDRDFELWVWDGPEIERDELGYTLRPPSYAVSVDVAEGLAGEDYSAINVFNCNTWEQVATMKCWWPVEDLGALVEFVGYWYHTALIGVERNNQGLVPIVYLQKAGYPRLVRMESVAQQSKKRSPRYGWFTNRSNKPKMVIEFVKWIRSQALTMRDIRWKLEAETFIADGVGGYAASGTAHDDLMMAVLIGAQIMDQVVKYPLDWQDYEKKPMTWDEFDEIMFGKQDEGKGDYGTPLGHSPATGPRKSWEIHPLNVTRG